MNFACGLELVLDLNLSRPIQQAAVPMGMWCLHGKCCFRASYRHMWKRRICLGKVNAQGPAALSVPGLWKGWLPTANVLERCCGPCNDHQPHFGKPRQPESVWFSCSQAVSWTEPRSAPQRVGEIQFYLHCWEVLWWLCLNLTQNLCTGAREI